MDEARAGGSSPSQKEKEELPEWIKLVGEYISMIKNSSTKINSDNNGKATGNEQIKSFTGLYGLALSRLMELERFADRKSGVIRFPVIFEKICKSFQMSKMQAWDLLFFLSDIGIVKIVPYQGIRICDGQTIGQILLDKSLDMVKKKYM